MEPVLKNIKYVYLLGIGGIGMSALARYFNAAGKTVAGYDKTPTDLTASLLQENIEVSFSDDPAQLPHYLTGDTSREEVLIIYTPAIPKEHKGMIHLLHMGYTVYKRSQVLGILTRTSRTIAVAGTHGKTTTSCMIAHMLKSSGIDCSAFLGGISANYNTNLLLGSGNPDLEWIVVEADEYDRSFLTLFPFITVITSLDPDHLDIYGQHEEMKKTYNLFASQTAAEGRLIYKASLEINNVKTPVWTYSITEEADFSGENIRIANHNYCFDIRQDSISDADFCLSWPGRHNVENALAAYAVGRSVGLSGEQIRNAMASFKGVKRRFEYQLKNERITYIDDYAHHPRELWAIISSVKEMYPDQKVLGIFQPHLFSRTRDFASGFGESLSLLDEVILMDIYPARELPLPGISAKSIADYITIPDKKIVPREYLVDQVLASDASVVLTLGAGDIDQMVAPIRYALAEKYTVTN